ncbi:MAG: DUF4396 domain-containing protein [Acidobacteriota bacterium]
MISALSAIVVALDLLVHGGKKMWIMDLVWPITALWAGPFAAWAYFELGRAERHDQPLPALAGKAATHCGAGCTLGDIAAALFAVGVPLSLGGYDIFGEWIYAYIAAFAIGIAFQYFTMPSRGWVAAVKADTLSLTAWQVGMYGWMAIARFAILGHRFDKRAPLFWVLMQAAMLCGFLTAWPVNAWLLRRGLKEAM